MIAVDTSVLLAQDLLELAGRQRRLDRDDTGLEDVARADRHVDSFARGSPEARSASPPQAISATSETARPAVDLRRPSAGTRRDDL